MMPYNKFKVVKKSNGGSYHSTQLPLPFILEKNLGAPDAF